MSWSYSGNPSTSANDEVRFLVGDTDTTDQLLQDEEIAWLITNCGTTRFAAVEAANGIAAKYSRMADKAVGDLRLSASQKSKQYFDLAKRLRRRAMVGSVTPYAGGITESDKNINRDNPDTVVPFFNREQGEIPGTGLPQQSIDPTLTEQNG